MWQKDEEFLHSCEKAGGMPSTRVMLRLSGERVGSERQGSVQLEWSILPWTQDTS